MSQKIRTSVDIDGSLTTNEFGISAGHIKLDTTPTNIPTSLGTIYWDEANRTAALIDGDGDTTLQLGQEQRALVHNNTGSTLTDGQIVYITGSTGEVPSVTLASSSVESTSATTLGMVTETIAHGSHGFITISGIVHGLNTLAFNEGDMLWLGTTPGTFTSTKPISPNHLVLIGYVVKKAGGNGSVFVKIQNTQELSESSDVLFTSLTNNDILTYESSSSLWKNKSISTILGYTPANDSNVVHKTGDETISGRKTFNSTTDIGIRSNISGNGYGIYSENSSNGISFYVANNGSGKAFSVSNTLGSFGNMYEGSYNGTSNFAVNYLGEITASKFIKSGGTAFEFLKANGDVDSNIYFKGSVTAGYLPKSLYPSSGDFTTSLIYDSGTKIGIGTTSPVYKFHVNDTSDGIVGHFSGGVSNYTLISFKSNEANVYSTSLGSYNSGLLFRTGATDRMYINSSGNVGIGTTSPSSKLNVSGDIHIGDYGSASSRVLDFRTNNSLFTITTDGTSGGLGTTISYSWANGGQGPLKFNNASGEVMRLSSGGNVGIGTTAPAQKLDVVGNIRISNTTPTQEFFSTGNGDVWGSIYSQASGTGSGASLVFSTKRDGNSATDKMIITQGGNVGIGTTSPSFQLQLSNDSAAKPGSPLWTVSSDIRIKENVRPYTDGLEKLMQVNPVYYDYNGKAGFSITKNNVGIIAQEMQEVLPNTIKTFKAKLNDDDEEETELLSFNANEIIYVLINSVKELKAEIELLKQN
jgi:hypothetical protein